MRRLDSDETTQDIGQREKIAQRIGMVPNFFSISEDPDVSNHLWQQVEFDYLDAPFPSLFKEKLFVYLSQYCASHYCLCRHIGFLVGLGNPSGDPSSTHIRPEEVLELLEHNIPKLTELMPILERFSRNKLAPDDWDTSSEIDLIVCFAILFQNGPESRVVARALRHFLGAQRFARAIKFTTFIRTAHMWTEAYPDLTLEPTLVEFFEQHPDLRNWISKKFSQPKIERLEELFQNSPELIQSVDVNGRFLFANEAWHSALGYSECELSEINLFDTIAPAYHEKCQKLFEQLRNGDVPETIETVFMAKDGSLFYVEGMLSPRFENDTFVSCRGFFRNITERKRTTMEQEGLVADLRASVLQAGALSDMLSVCSWCKKVKNSRSGSWDEIVQFLEQTPEVRISHAICPCCVDKIE